MGCRFHPRQLVLVPPVEEDLGVEVPVPGVKHVGDGQAVSGPDLRDAVESLGQLRPGNRGILNHQIRREAPEGAECLLPALPQGLPLGRIGRPANLAGTGIETETLRPGRVVVQRRIGSVELDDQRGRREQAVADDGGDGPGRVFQGVKDGQQGSDTLGNGHEPHLHLGGDGEAPLRPHHQPHEIVSGGGIAARSPQLHHLPTRENHRESRDVAGRDAVLEAVRPPGVLCNVAPDGAGRLGRRIRSVVKTVRSHRVAQRAVHHSCLDPRDTIGGIHGEDAGHPGSTQHDASLRCRRPGERGECRSRGAPPRRRPPRRSPRAAPPPEAASGTP